MNYSIQKLPGFILSLLILICAGLEPYCATRFVQRTWTSKDGMEDSNTYGIAQSTDETLFAVHGPPASINYIDGYKVKSITMPDQTSKLTLDSEDQLWTALSQNERTRITGFQVYHESTAQWKPYYFLDFFTDITIPITRWAFFPVFNSNILFTHGSFLYSFVHQSNSLTILYSLSDDNIFLSSSSAKGKDTIWFPHQNGVVKVSWNTQTTSDSFQFNHFTFDHLPQMKSIQNLIIIQDNEWYGTAELTSPESFGLIQFKNDKLEVIYIQDKPLQWGWKQSDDSAWIIDLDNQLQYIDLNTQTVIVSEKLNTQIQDISLHPNSSFTLATQHGIIKFMPALFQPVEGLSNQTPIIHSILEDSNQRILLAAIDTIYLFEKGKWKQFPLPENLQTISAYSHSLFELPNGNIAIICASSSLNNPYDFPPFILLFNPSTESFEKIHHSQNRSIFSIVQRENGGLWIKTKDQESGQYLLELYENGVFTDRYNQSEIPDLFSMRSLIETNNGELWISHVDSHGPGMFDGSQFRVYKSNDGYTGSGAFYVMEDKDHFIWAGSRDALFRFQDEKWTLIHGGLDAVRSIIQSNDSSIWVASGNGLHHYKNNAWVTYDENDSLPSSHVFEVFEDSLGRIWVGTSSGVCIYHPENDIDAPDTWIDPIMNNAEFTHKNLVQIKSSGMDKWKYTIQDHLLFSYQTGNSEWSDFQSSPLLHIHDLKPGKHILKVRAMDRNFNVDETPALYNFSVHPIPLQNRQIFLPVVIGIVFLLSTLLFLLLRSRYKLAYYTQHLETLVLDRTKKLKIAEHMFINAIEHEQQRIGNELHDGVVQDLAAIAITGDVIAKELKETDNPYSKDLQIIVSMIDRSAMQIRDLSKGLSPIQLDFTGLISKFEQIASQISQNNSIQCLFKWDEKQPAIEPKKLLHIYRFVQEAVNNALKHSQADLIQIELRHQSNRFCIMVKDNGIGMNYENHQNKGMGVHTLHYRADELEGKFTIESQPNQGTKVICSIPIRQNEK